MKVTVIEQGHWPRDKVCGEGIMPAGVALLEQAGVLGHIDKSQCHSFNGIQYRDGAIHCLGYFDSGSGLGVRRSALSAALYERATREPHITLWEASQLVSLEKRRDRITVKIRGKHPLWQGDFIVGADGLQSRLRKLVGANTLKLTNRARLGARLHLEVSPHEQVPQVQVYWGKGVEAYLTPSGEGMLEVAFLWEQKRSHAKARDLEDWLWSQFPELEMRYRHRARLSEFRALGGFGQRSSQIAGEYWALVGDAAYFYDGITGEGLSLGFAMGRCLAVGLATSNLRDYQKRSNRLIRHNIYLTRLALFMGRHPVLRSLAMRAMRRGLLSRILAIASRLDVPRRPSARAFQTFSKWA